MDEMELYITRKALKIAYGYTVIFLFAWMIVDFFTKGKFGVAWFLVISQNLILLFSKQYFEKKINRNEE